MRKDTILNFILEIKIEIEKLRLTNSRLAADALTLLNNIIYEKKDSKSLEEVVSLISAKINAEYLSGLSVNEQHDKINCTNSVEDNETTKFFINELENIKNKISIDNSNDLIKELDEIVTYFYQRIDSFNLAEKVKIYELISDVRFLLLLNNIKNNNELVELTEDNYIQVLYGIYFSKIEDNTIKEKIDRMKFYKPIENYEKLNEFLNDLIDKKTEIEAKKPSKKNANIKHLKRKYGSYEKPKIIIKETNSCYGPYRTIASYINEREEYIKFYIWGEQNDNTIKKIMYISKLEIHEIFMQIFYSKRLANSDFEFDFIIEIEENIENIKEDKTSENARIVSLKNEYIGTADYKIIMNCYKDRESFSISNPYAKIIFEEKSNIDKIKSISYKFVDFLNKKVQVFIVIEKEHDNSIVSIFIDGKLVEKYNIFNDNLSIEEILFLKNFDISKYSDNRCLNPIIFLNNSVNYPSYDISDELQTRIIEKDGVLFDKYTKESFVRVDNNIILKAQDGTTMKVVIAPYSEYPLKVQGYYINEKQVSKDDFFTYRFSYLELIKDKEEEYEKEKMEKARNLVRKLNSKKVEN